MIIRASLAFALALALLGASAPASAQSTCTATDFGAVVDQTAQALRELNVNGSKRYQAKVAALRDKLHLSQADVEARTTGRQDEKIDGYNRDIESLVAQMDVLSQTPNAKITCEKLEELRRVRDRLLAAMGQKSAYMLARIETELEAPASSATPAAAPSPAQPPAPATAAAPTAISPPAKTAAAPPPPTTATTAPEPGRSTDPGQPAAPKAAMLTPFKPPVAETKPPVVTPPVVTPPAVADVKPPVTADIKPPRQAEPKPPAEPKPQALASARPAPERLPPERAAAPDYAPPPSPALPERSPGPARSARNTGPVDAAPPVNDVGRPTPLAPPPYGDRLPPPGRDDRLAPPPPGDLAQPPEDAAYSIAEIREAGRGVFGTITAEFGGAINYAFQQFGQPNAYISGVEGGAAFLAGLRYGKGTIYRKSAGPSEIFWQSPSAGLDFGAEGSRALFLVYNLNDPSAIYGRFSGIGGSAYIAGGVGLNVLGKSGIVMVPIRSGLGLRLGANLAYVKFTERQTWNPF